MTEPGEQLNPTPDSPKSLIEWSEQDINKFVDPFSFDNFELVAPKQADEKGFVRVKLPVTAEPMARGLIRTHQQLAEAFGAPLDEESQEKVRGLIGDTANTVNASEAEEAEWIQMFGEFTDVAGMMAGKPDPALEVLRTLSRQLAHDAVARELAILLGVANASSWDNFMDEQREKYKTPEDLPKDAEAAIIAQYENYQNIGELVKGNSEADQAPRFVLINPQGKEIFRSTPSLDAS